MSDKNTVVQTAKMDNSDYKKGVREVRQESEKTSRKVSQGAKEASENYQKATNENVRNTGRTAKSLKELAKQFKNSSLENLYRGGVVAGAVALGASVKSSFDQAKKSVFDLDKIMAKMGSRFDFSTEKLKKMRNEFTKLGKQTGVNSGEIGAAGEILLRNGGGTQGIDSIARASAMGGGQANEVARNVIDYLKGSGQNVNGSNIEKFLGSASAMTRGGDISLSEAISSLSSQAQVKAKLGLSDRESGGMLAAATNVGQDREVSVAGMQALMAKSAEGFFGDSGLAAMLGVEGGFKTDGKFDISKLRDASQNLNSQGFEKADFIKLLEGSGLGGQEAEGLYSILSEFDEFETSFKKVVGDNKKLSQAFSEESDNLPDNLKKFNEGFAKATDEILSPLTKVGSDFISGDFGKAFKNLPGALMDSGEGVADNKAQVGMALGALGIGGLLTKKLGLFGSGASYAKSQVFEKVTGEEVQSVYVVNASEISNGVSGGSMLSSLDFFKKGKLGQIFGKGGMGKALSSGGRMLSRLGLPALGVGAAGAVGYGVGTLAEGQIDKRTQGKSSDGAFEGNIVERLFYKLDSLVGGDNAKALQKAQKLEIEVVENDRLMVKPSMKDLPRSVD